MRFAAVFFSWWLQAFSKFNMERIRALSQQKSLDMVDSYIVANASSEIAMPNRGMTKNFFAEF